MASGVFGNLERKVSAGISETRNWSEAKKAQLKPQDNLRGIRNDQSLSLRAEIEQDGNLDTDLAPKEYKET